MTLDAFQLGEPVEHRGIVVAPLFPRRDPVAAYITLDEALPRGLRITETSRLGLGARALRREPDSTSAVLLYDGEELVGAKQNRILNVSVLVGAGAKLPIPVSCVEQGRWSRRSDVVRLREAHLALPPPPPQGRDARRAAARARARPGRGLGRGAREAVAHGRPLARPPRTATRSRRTAPGCGRSSRRSRSRPASAAPCSGSATTCASTPSPGRTPSRCSGRSSAPGTCSTRSSGSTGGRRRSSASRRSSPRSARRAATRGPSAGLGEDVRLRGEQRRSARGSSSRARRSSSRRSRARTAARGRSGGSRGRAADADHVGLLRR